MRHVTADEFYGLLRARGSATLRAQLDRLDLGMVLGAYAKHCYVHDGDVTSADNWHPAPPNLIVVGSVHAGALVNLAPSLPGVDEGGSLWVLGDLDCRHFASYYRKFVHVDGNMTVSGIAVTAFEDSCLRVSGDVRARYFFGDDIWLEAGGKMSFDYGIGYGLPLGYQSARTQAVRPQHDEAASLALLNLGSEKELRALADRISNGEPFGAI